MKRSWSVVIATVGIERGNTLGCSKVMTHSSPKYLHLPHHWEWINVVIMQKLQTFFYVFKFTLSSACDFSCWRNKANYIYIQSCKLNSGSKEQWPTWIIIINIYADMVVLGFYSVFSISWNNELRSVFACSLYIFFPGFSRIFTSLVFFLWLILWRSRIL